MDAIIIDEDSNDVIDVDAHNSDADVKEVSNIKDLRKMGRYDDIIKENKLFGEFIDKCLELDYSDGMKRVINKSLIPSYLRTSRAYRATDSFNKVMTKALCNIATQPNWKFSIVKDLCESLKASRKRRKEGLNLPNLATKKKAKLKKKPTYTSAIVLSDDSDGYEVPIINLEEYTKDNRTELRSKSKDPVLSKDSEQLNFIEIDIEDEIFPSVSLVTNDDDNAIKDSEPLELTQLDNEKENNTNNVKTIESSSKPVKTGENNLVVHKKRQREPLLISVPTVCISDEETSNDMEVRNPEPSISDVDKLLVPLKEEAFSGYDEQMIMGKIKNIESEIAAYKLLVAEFEEREVVDDSYCSPYIVCDSYKAKIVNLYDQLCKLTGEKPVKKREVRLKAVDERSKLPMQMLENFINSNIGSDGLPHFPDFYDVVQCVKDANYSGNLGWSNYKIMNEARALFTYCGQALQKNRQRREWRDMLHLVKNELIEDPADNDPELMARLQANRKRGVIRETELIDRYSDMGYHRAEIEEAGDSEEENETVPQTDKTSTHSDNAINRVRIVPISVPFKITRIVNKDNQVEVVISKDNNTNNDINKTSIENRTSPKSTSKDNAVLDTENKTSQSIICAAEELCRDTKITEELSLRKDTKIAELSSNNKTGEVLSINTKIAEEPSRNTGIGEELRNETQKSVPDVCSTISSCSISLMLALAGGKPIMPVEVPNITSTAGNGTITTQNNTEVHFPEKESSQSVCQSEYDNPSNANVETASDNTPQELDQDNCIVSSSNTAVETNVNDNNNEEITTQPVLENESLDISTDNINNTDKTINNENPSSPSSIDILKRYLNARVVLQKMKIRYESNYKSKETNDVPANDDEHETVQNSEVQVKIKEEPCIDIQHELDKLGDNFTTTVFDIQDPFLVLEISSDSESEDEEVEHSNDDT